MNHEIVDSVRWREARKALLEKEKELGRARDELAAARRALPWERVEKEYVFDDASGKVTLAELFDGRSQLVVYHFMFAPEWEAGCKSCSFWADNFERNVVHLAHRDATMIAISRAPVEKLHAFRARLGWTFRWVSSGANDFNYDYEVSFHQGERGNYNFSPNTLKSSDLPGFSVFRRDDGGAVYRTYSTYARGIELANAAYAIMDFLPKGRDEDGLDFSMAWLRHRDRYEPREHGRRTDVGA